ncbi:MAG: hypothetical protein RLZZ344_1388 [Pseudomonadota bacterium]
MVDLLSALTYYCIHYIFFLAWKVALHERAPDPRLAP